jgi:hypothetical protein
VAVERLFGGKTKSCGCLQRELRDRAFTSAAALAWNRSEGNAIHLCEARARAASWPTTHGLHKHPPYHTWRKMLDRWENPEHHSYRRYGARGVTVCERWHDVRNFVADIEAEIGPRPEGRTSGGMPVWTLDRMNVNGNYEPGNVQWATAKEQAVNRRPRRRTGAVPRGSF